MNINDKSGSNLYQANPNRYQQMTYNRVGKSGVLLPAISLGLWHNFGAVDSLYNAEDILRTAFDVGITHFDLANNYGPPYGSAESNFGAIFKNNFKSHRDELFIATKAGYDMWSGPYGNGGSRKYLISSLDQSLKRMDLDYVDIYYHHRPDVETPIEETALALADMVRQGKALYIGLSRYNSEQTNAMIRLFKELNVPFVLHQDKYSILDRSIEKDGLLNTLDSKGLGCITFSPLAQGLLTDKYLNGIPENSRASKSLSYLSKDFVNQEIEKVRKLHQLSQERGQKLSQMAIAWLLQQKSVCSVLIGASSSHQLKENIKALDQLTFTEEELKLINQISL
ncbi:L-glyceraldehyde 3-phosphate reductase [Wenyingzhuangia sp. IMCC45533]